MQYMRSHYEQTALDMSGHMFSDVGAGETYSGHCDYRDTFYTNQALCSAMDRGLLRACESFSVDVVCFRLQGEAVFPRESYRPRTDWVEHRLPS